MGKKPEIIQDIICSCPKCQRTLKWGELASGDETICPKCLTHYRIKSGEGEFVSERKAGL